MMAYTVNLTLNANTDLGLLRNFNHDLYSSGSIVLATTVRGSMAKPLMNGRLELRNASASYTGLPNGIANANGVVLFNGASASMRNVTAESGGGTVTLGGFVAFSEVVGYHPA